jgi:hypothetical protein
MESLNSINEKALKVNLNPTVYGTFAEIGAGQEVVRYFFHAGSASGTIAKSMSAYDKSFSDDIYGKDGRYVCEARLHRMLDKEYSLLIRRLDKTRGEETCFFAYANTVATDAKGTGHAWMGIAFQTHPKGKVNKIIIHVRLFDTDRIAQQEVVGIAGVNLVHGAFFLNYSSEQLIESLGDFMIGRKFDIDMIRFDGPHFKDLDHRKSCLHLVKCGLTKAALFGTNGITLQPAESLYKKHVLVLRGSFRPVTKINVDMLDSALKQFCKDYNLDPKDVVTITEISLQNILAGKEENQEEVQDFLDRATLLQHLGHKVMISNYAEFYLLSSFLNKLTDGHIAMVIGTPRLKDLFDEKYYVNIEGGILEAFGRLFRNKLHFYAYPWMDTEEKLLTAYNLGVSHNQEGLYRFLLDNNLISALDNYAPELTRLRLSTNEVLECLLKNDATWENYVPKQVADQIKEMNLFGYKNGDA